MLLGVIPGLWEYGIFFVVVYIYFLDFYNAHMTFEIIKSYFNVFKGNIAYPPRRNFKGCSSARFTLAYITNGKGEESCRKVSGSQSPWQGRDAKT